MVNFFKKPNLFTIMTCDICNTLDALINSKLDCGIDKLGSDDFFINIIFKDGVKCSMWNANKYYGWLSMGNIGNYNWVDVRPRKRTMRRLEREINKFINK